MSRATRSIFAGPNTVIIIGVLIVLGILTSSIFATAADEGFAIYLTEPDVPPAQMEVLSHITLTDRPVISSEDIITYSAQTHEIRLTDQAFERICALEVPVQGRAFMVCIDKQSIYWGAFWTPISSISFDGVTIWQPYCGRDPAVITLQLGYPSSSFYGGEDPRNSPEILGSLEQAGKLMDRLSITSVEELPGSFKGYELYSWEEEGRWHFTLITGTNRVKTVEEITTEEDFVSETGWVKLQVVGADAIRDVLRRLPEGESVFWCDELHIGQSTETDFRLPPEQVADEIEEYAEQCRLDLVVTVRSC